jgi:hypothetical protein
MKTKLFIIIPLIFLLISSCKKHEDNELPAATQTGANTFGCKINGVNWVANGSNDSFYPQALQGGIRVIDTSLSGTLNQFKRQLLIRAYNKDKSSFNLVIGKEPFANTYLINKTTIPEPAESNYINYGAFSGMGGWYMTDSTHQGSITITYYNESRCIVAGTFQFDAVNKNTGEVIHVTEGRFDRYLCKQ